jgi:recombinational DNA repair protein RecR
MARVGDELHAQREAIEALRADADKHAEKTDIDALRHRFIAKIAELELANEQTAENVRAINTAVFHLSNSLEKMHSLLARVASALDCEHVLTAVDKHHLPEGEQKSATVLSIADLRSVG